MPWLASTLGDFYDQDNKQLLCALGKEVCLGCCSLWPSPVNTVRN